MARIETEHSVALSIAIAKPIIGPSSYFENVTIDGLYLEFGVALGNSIRGIGQLNPTKTIYGFDSFKGLPEAWGTLPKGCFACQPPTNLPANVVLIIGLFQDTLEEFLSSHPGNVAFVHIDSDIYSAAKYVLTTLAPRIISGTIIAFDEIYGHINCKDNNEGRAFAEFLNETGLRAECLGHCEDKAVFSLHAD